MRKEWISDEDYFKIEGHGKEMGAMLKGLTSAEKAGELICQVSQ